MKKRKIRPRAVICLIAIFIIVIAAIWMIATKLLHHSEPPVITLKEDKITLNVNDLFKVDNYIESVKDDEDNLLTKSDKEKEKGTYWISSNVDMGKAGTYQVTVYALDLNGNQAEKQLTVIVSEVVDPNEANEGNGADEGSGANEEGSNADSGNNGSTTQTMDNSGYDDSIDPTNAQPYYVNGILLVNKRHPLPPSFGALDPEAAAALERLQGAAAKAGYSIPTVSGFRTYDYQVTLYNSYVERDGQAAADTYSARPGFSEHQTGMVFDVGAIDDYYGETPEGTWLREHCHEFGFIIRYPQGKENITGYMYEPWHIRYVGKEAATQIYQKGITLEEYLGVY